jgi:hypothetical protein
VNVTVLRARERAKFEEKLSREARRFDLKPLLDLLIAKGYEREEMLFESTQEGTSSSVIEALQFRKKPFRGILITLNLGLLGDNSLLPSYFFQVIEASRDPERFFDFIRFFDHLLIDNFLRAVYPEEGGAYTDYRLVQRSFFRMLGPGSESTLQWLVQLYFPELRVRVSRRAFESTTASHACRTGASKLDGTGVIGRIYRSDATGFTVDLFAEEETDSRGRGWAEIVEQRLETYLLPLLAPFRIPLIVRLRVLYHASWAKVDGPFDEDHGYLGYDRLRGDPESGHTAIIYRGVTGETKWSAHAHT